MFTPPLQCPHSQERDHLAKAMAATAALVRGNLAMAAVMAKDGKAKDGKAKAKENALT